MPIDNLIISSFTYDRFYQKYTAEKYPVITQLAQDYYALIRRQKHIMTFTGKGPTIEIYQKI